MPQPGASFSVEQHARSRRHLALSCNPCQPPGSKSKTVSLTGSRCPDLGEPSEASPTLCCRVWVFWINPMQYAQRAILINEFTDPHWQHLLVPGSTHPLDSVSELDMACDMAAPCSEVPCWPRLLQSSAPWSVTAWTPPDCQGTSLPACLKARACCSVQHCAQPARTAVHLHQYHRWIVAQLPALIARRCVSLAFSFARLASCQRLY